jgi:EAL domain-containing protein (putative c-di-GMP-specific phosphodiesterase class I)
LVGAEALLRWHHPERGLIMPGGFIEALAKSPVSLEVGRWVLQNACQQAAQWQKFGPFRMGVNLFPAQFSETIIFDDVARALDLSGLPPSMLEIEITENIALRQDEAILAPLRQLRDQGVSLAFDDFGTGYASLSYLRRYPLTRLKIDKSFVQKLDRVSSKQDASIVRSIIHMSHNLDLEVIAEGVETIGQTEFLRTE